MDLKTILSLVIFSSINCLSFTSLYAQKTDPDADVNLWVQQPVKVDGVSDEWHEPLNNYNAATKVTTRKQMSGGLTLDIN